MKGMNGWTANKASEKSGISEIELYKKTILEIGELKKGAQNEGLSLQCSLASASF